MVMAVTFSLLIVSLVSLLAPKGAGALPAAPCAAESSDLAPCFGVVTLDATVWHLSCLNWSCAQTCSARRLPFLHPLTNEWTTGLACTCGGVPSPCCKLFIREHEGEPEIYAVGKCSAQLPACPQGDWCGAMWRLLPGGTEVTPECFPAIPW